MGKSTKITLWAVGIFYALIILLIIITAITTYDGPRDYAGRRCSPNHSCIQCDYIANDDSCAIGIGFGA